MSRKTGRVTTVRNSLFLLCFKVQGMSFIAAVLLLNMDPPDAFICFANILNKPCQLAFFRVDHSMVSKVLLCYFILYHIISYHICGNFYYLVSKRNGRLDRRFPKHKSQRKYKLTDLHIVPNVQNCCVSIDYR